MKKLMFLLIPASLFFFTACGDDDAVLGDTGSVNLNFKSVYGDSPLVCNNGDYVYQYPDGRDLRFGGVEFFIAEVSLMLEGSTDEVELIDIEYVNLSEMTTLEEALEGITLSLPNIPTGKYRGIRIDIGVPNELNNLSNEDLGSSHPLNRVTPWSAWGSYIFFKVSGIYDIDGDGIGNGSDVTMAHPVGGNEMYHSLQLLKPIELTADKDLNLNVVLDVEKLYKDDNGHLDLTDVANQTSHLVEDLEHAPTYIKANYDDAFSLE
jgi:hypothetical protein